MCIVCGRVLDYWEFVGWQHSIVSDDPGEIDHPPIPVSPEEAGDQLRPRCDFCYADDPIFRLPARTFGQQPSVSVGDWAACEMCARCIEKDAWNSLLRRVVASWEARHGHAMPDDHYRGVQRLYRNLRKNVTGSIRREDAQ